MRPTGAALMDANPVRRMLGGQGALETPTPIDIKEQKSWLSEIPI